VICDDYVSPSSVEEALAILASLQGEGRIIGGGTDLIIQLLRKERSALTLVDVSRIPGLDDIRAEGAQVVIGAAATHSQIALSPTIQKHVPLLAEAVSWIGSPQIRNVGTLAGNVVNAQPAADGAIALLALDAEAEIANLTGRQWVPVGKLCVSPGVSRVDATSEMITAFRVNAASAREGFAYERRARRRVLALPLINVAARVWVDSDGSRMRDVRLAAGPVALVPFRAVQTEAVLRGQPISSNLIEEALATLLTEAKPRSSLLRASKEYRRELLAELSRRALTRAIDVARGTGT